MAAAAALEARGDLAGALRAIDEAVVLAPRMIEALAVRAKLRLNTGDRAGAIASYRAAAAVSPSTPLARLCMGRALVEQNRDAEAARWLRQTVARFPDLAPAHGLLALVEAEAGHFDAAAESFDRAISLDDSQVALYYDRVRARTLTEADAPLVAAMGTALARQDLSPRQRMAVELALGKACDDLGDPAAAMAHRSASAAIAATAAPFNRAGLTRMVDLMIAHFTPALFQRYSGPADGDPLPVLIVGMPRSGTTLVEQILSSHADIAGAGELDHWSRALAGAVIPSTAASLDAMSKIMGADYLAALRTAGRKALRVTDKLPQNFLALGFAHLLYPNARFIHCRRSLIDTCLSIHATFFAPKRSFPATAGDLVHYAREYLRLMEHWRRVLPADRLFEVDYETLTADPEPVIRDMVAFTGLEWDPACLAPEQNQRAIKTPSKWQARRPINRDSVERWRRYEPWLGELAALLPPS
jgi:tetratricopeptide (TPR) repeat protein